MTCETTASPLFEQHSGGVSVLFLGMKRRMGGALWTSGIPHVRVAYWRSWIIRDLKRRTTAWAYIYHISLYHSDFIVYILFLGQFRFSRMVEDSTSNTECVD